MVYETVAKRTRQQKARNSWMLSEKVKMSRKEAERKWKKKRNKKVGSELVVSGYHHSNNGGDDDEVVWLDETEFKKKVGLIEYEEKLLIENVGFHENMELVPVEDDVHASCGCKDGHLEGEKEGKLCEDMVGVDAKGKGILVVDDGANDDGRGEDQWLEENGKGILAIDDGGNDDRGEDNCVEENGEGFMAVDDGANDDQGEDQCVEENEKGFMVKDDGAKQDHCVEENGTGFLGIDDIADQIICENQCVEEIDKGIMGIDDGVKDTVCEDACEKENQTGSMAVDDGVNDTLCEDVCKEVNDKGSDDGANDIPSEDVHADENEKVFIATNDAENNDDSDSSLQILGERYNPLAYEGNEEEDDDDFYETPLAVQVVNLELGDEKTQNSVLVKEKKGDKESIEKNDALEAQQAPDSDVLPTSSSEEDDDFSDKDFRIGKSSSSEDTMSSDYAKDKDEEQQEGEKFKDKATVEVRKRSKEKKKKKKKKKKVSKEQRKSDGLILTTPAPDSEFSRKRTRSFSKVNATWSLYGGSSSRQPIVLDAEELSSTDREYTDDEEQEVIPVVHVGDSDSYQSIELLTPSDGLVPDAVLVKRKREKLFGLKRSGKERKSKHEMRGESEMEKIRRLVMRSDKKKMKSEMEKNGDMEMANEKKKKKDRKEKKTVLQSPLKKKRVKGLNTELQQALLSTMTDPNGEAPGFDEFMSSTNDSYLQLKFTFGVEKVEPPEKAEEELELDSLWKDLDFALDAFNIGSHNHDWDAKEDTFSTDSGRCQQMLCNAGRHHLVVDEEVGIFCSYCSFVSIEMKDVTPDFNENPFGNADKKQHSGRSQSVKGMGSGGFQFPDGNNESQDDQGPPEDTQGTVWDLIPGTKQTLYPHQQEGFEFIWRSIAGGITIEELRKSSSIGLGGCIICHAPGTGKTRLAIVFLQSFLKQFPTSKPVIIAPSSMLLTWEEEFARWDCGIPFFNMNKHELSGDEDHQIHGMMKNARLEHKTIRIAKLFAWVTGRGVLGISYTLFEKLAGERKGTDERVREILLKRSGVLVLDEGHTPRNDNSLIWKVLSNVETKRRIILSGTPFQNNFHELHNTISLVREEFGNSIVAGNDRDYNKKSWKTKRFGRDYHSKSKNQDMDSRRIEELRKRIKPFVHVHKGEILKNTLRGLFDSVVILNPSELQKTCFKHLVKLKGSFELDHLVSIASVHPSLLFKGESVPEFVDQSFKDLLKKHEKDLDAGVKIRFVFELVKLSKDERVLVFSQYLLPLTLLLELLKSHFKWTDGKEILLMEGRQDVKQRQSFIRHFNDPKSEARVLLASTRACCEGIHLVGASRVVLLDVVWNPSVERQAISRAYRLGQVKDVFVYHLLTGKQETGKYYRQATKDRLSELVFSEKDKDGRHEKVNFSSKISEDKILQEMLLHDKTKSMFESIIYQPKADTLIETFSSVNL